MDTRVLNIMLASGRGGVETMALRYHEALCADGYAVRSVGHPSGVLAKSLAPKGFDGLHSLCNFDIFAAARLYEIVRDFQPHVILCHGNRATNLSLMPFVAGDAQVVQVLHNQCFKSHLKRVDAAICVSSGVSKGLFDYLPGIKAFEVANFSHLEASEVKLTPNKPPVIGVLGRLHEIKGFDLLLQAAAVLRDRGVDFRLKLAGDGPEMQRLRDLQAELHLIDRVDFCGWLARPEDFLAKLDLFVLPSRYEAFGLALAEAMAAGVPVVASDLRGPADILDNGRFGRLCPVGDAAGLADAIGSVFADWPAALATARAAQLHALKSYGFEAGSARLRGAIEALRAGLPYDAHPIAAEDFAAILPAE